MLFKRRKPAEFWERLRVWFWPRRSFWRSAKYFSKRILRLRATPHAIAAGVAAGVFASFFPLGVHILIAAAVAWLVAGNLVAAAIGTAFGNPLTFPFMWGATYEVGYLILHGRQPGSTEPSHIGDLFGHMDISGLWDPLLKPMTVGALPLGLVFAVVFYFVTRWAVAAFHARRRVRLSRRADSEAEAVRPPAPAIR
jgi:uncharacterized protein (DUF2062 family)